MAAWCVPGLRRRSFSLVVLAMIIAMGSSAASAHRSLVQNAKQDSKQDKDKADKGSPQQYQGQPGSNVEQLSSCLNRKGNFMKNANAKESLQELGPDAVQQILLNAGNLNRATLEEGAVALENLLLRSNDMIIDVAALAIQAQCPPADPPTAEQLATAAAAAASAGSRINGNGSGLSSKPTAINKIWLDFVCGNVTNTRWNEVANLTVITMPPFDKAGDGPGFSNLDLIDMEDIWKSVAEDYAPFNVDVTTNPPAAGASPATYVRVMICDGGDWYTAVNNGTVAGGVAWVGSWARSDLYLSPAFVFAKYQYYYVKNVWEAASHEIGHVFGLTHDGNSTNEYYAGTPDWSPIMGGNTKQYYAVTQWSKGEYPDANNKGEDDIAIIASKLGWAPTPLSRSPGTGCSATTMALPITVFSNPQVASINGLILQSYMQDVYSFSAGNGTATVSCDVAANWATTTPRSNLDCQVTVISPTGVMLLTANPVGTGSSPVGLGTGQVQVNLPTPGTYYVYVQGMGYGDPMAGGYSAYGSIGTYSLVVQYPPVPPSPPPSAAPAPTGSPLNAAVATPVKASVTSGYTCSVIVTVKSGSVAGSGTLIGNATVDVLWFHTYAAAIAGWDNSAGLLRSGVTATSKTTGTVTIVSPTMPKSAGGCRARVGAVRLSGYYLIQQVDKNLTWTS